MKAKILYGLVGLSLVAAAWAFPSMGWMTSPSYEVPTQVLDCGGALSSSTGFTLVGAMGQSTPIGLFESASYGNRAGYIAQVAMLSASCRDDDGDGYDDEACGGDDCDDTDPAVNPGAEEVCVGGIDEDCDDLTDDADPDCIEYFSLELDAYEEAGFLHLDFTVGTPEPATWSNFLILVDPTTAIVPLWEISLPVLDPPFEIPVAFPCPSLGVIWVFSVLFAEEIPQAYVLEWADTGLPVQ